MDDPADVSSQNGPGWYLLDWCAATRNRKVIRFDTDLEVNCGMTGRPFRQLRSPNHLANSGHSAGHSTCGYWTRLERTGWTSHPT
jgi:hypothetical protein